MQGGTEVFRGKERKEQLCKKESGERRVRVKTSLGRET